ncbi:hypothetical protein [Tissierella praeacuta]|uniref:hypothetical protein n=1 Tax=Tissierella praeacuta TaxID=43131 RepID=UPI00289D93A1|nr:hypothetical protein [Tissierella praeacuta]
MIKEFMKKLTVIALALILVLPNISLAAEQEDYPSAEEVFTQEELEILEKEVEKKI